MISPGSRLTLTDAVLCRVKETDAWCRLYEAWWVRFPQSDDPCLLAMLRRDQSRHSKTTWQRCFYYFFFYLLIFKKNKNLTIFFLFAYFFKIFFDNIKTSSLIKCFIKY